MTSPAQGAALPPGAVRGLACPSCGAAIVLRAAGWTQTVACASCTAVLDATDPNLRVLRRAAEQMRITPRIPLGTRGTLPAWQGIPYDAVGFQRREIVVDDVAYGWSEYVLFNPYHGFRYLTEYDGHWSDVVALPMLVGQGEAAGRMTAQHDGTTFRHFQSASARTTYVLGEFPWEARTGDVVRVMDFVAPPHMLSAEADGHELTWSLGTYVPGDAVWRGFALPDSAPAAQGVYASQPSPWQGRQAPIWATFAVLAAAAMVLLLGRLLTARDAEAFTARYTYAPERGSEAAFVTPSFTLAGARANVVLETWAGLDDQWMFVDYALVNEATGQVFGTGREIDYYDGVDADGSWTEGSRTDRVRLGPVPGGRYFLRIEPAGGDRGRPPVDWRVTVRRDVPSPAYLMLAVLVLLVPPVIVSLQAASFETRRWAESDHAPSSSASSDDEDDA
ncbi:MAG TPA: DUF4178 domain-containing protein [Gemmatirosa sp.]|nr:DUF4178 domain-containing protein [Gemmatirosa sp.]